MFRSLKPPSRTEDQVHDSIKPSGAAWSQRRGVLLPRWQRPQDLPPQSWRVMRMWCLCDASLHKLFVPFVVFYGGKFAMASNLLAMAST